MINKKEYYSLEDVYNDITDNGDINYMGIGSYENFKHRYEGFKENLKKKLPNFTFEELLKIYHHSPVIREEVYGFYNHDIFLDVLKFEIEDGYKCKHELRNSEKLLRNGPKNIHDEEEV